MRIPKKLLWIGALLAVWPCYGLLLIPFYPIPYPSYEWHASRIGMLCVAIGFAFSTAKLLNKVFES